MDTIVFTETKCREAKAVLGKIGSAMSVWGTEFSPSRSIGKCSYLYKVLQPTSYEDFYEKYIKYAAEHPDESIPNRGLTEKELIELGHKYKRLSEENADYEQPLYMYVYDAICHIIVETYDGMEKERDALRLAKQHDGDVQPATYEYDSDYGMDMLSIKGGKIKYGIQIKPITFFRSTREDVKKDRRLMCIKHDKALKELDIETFYMIYERTPAGITWKTHEGNKLLWRFKDVVEYDGKEVFVKI